MRRIIRDLVPGQQYAVQFRSNNGEEFSEWSQVQRFTTTSDTIPPSQPTNLTWFDSGPAYIGQWDKVTTQATAPASPLKDFRYYRCNVTSGAVSADFFVLREKFEFTREMNIATFGTFKTALTLKVYAVDNTYNESTPATVTVDPANPPVPSAPTLSLLYGSLLVEWNGLTNASGAMPSNLSYVEVHAGTTSTFTASDSTLREVIRMNNTATVQRALLTGLTNGTQYWVRLNAVNVLGKKSGASAVSNGVIKKNLSGVDIENGQITTTQINFTARDIGAPKAFYQTTQPTTGMVESDVWFDTDDGYHQYVYSNGAWRDVRDTTIGTAQSRADQAFTSASGKNTVTYSTSVPSDTTNPGTRAGDIWWVRNATTGVITAQYEWSGSTWNARTLDNAVIANLDAGKITAGTISAARIGAKTITADKLTIGDADNLQENADLEAGSAGWSGSFVIDTAKKRYGTQSMRIDSAGAIRDALGTPVRANGEAGEQFYAEAWVLASNTTTAGTLQLGATTVSQTGALGYPSFTTFTASQLSTTVWTKVSGIVTLAAGQATIALRPSIRETVPSGLSIWMDDIVFRRVTKSVEIADGAIVADKLSANAVTSAKINAGAVTADAIGTNLVITAKANIGNALIDTAHIDALNASVITAGVLQSKFNVSYGGIVQPAWSLDVNGNAIFNNATVNGQVVVGNSNSTELQNAAFALRSWNYVTGSAGWTINGDGSVEFANAIVRGIYKSAETGRRIEMGTDNDDGRIRLISDDGSIGEVSSFSATNTGEIGQESMRLRMIIPNPSVTPHTSWNALQIQQDERVYLQSGSLVFAYGGGPEPVSVGFGIYEAASRGTVTAAPALTPRLLLDENGEWHDIPVSKPYRFGWDDANSDRVEFRGGSPYSSPRVCLYNNLTGGALKFYSEPGVTSRIEARWWDDSGLIQLYASNLALSSDATTKENIEEVDRSTLLSAVRGTKVKKYRRKRGPDYINVDEGLQASVQPENPEEIGLIAQEAPAQIVSSPASDGTLTIDLYQMASMTWGSVQELANQIDELKAEITELRKNKK